MQIKGTSVISTHSFVKKKFPQQESSWIASLPEESKKLYTEPVMATNWYPVEEGMLIPVQKIADYFYEGNLQRASYEIGVFSAFQGLNGVYKIFVKMASPSFVLNRSPKIFNTYYSDVNFEITESEKQKAVFKITGFDKKCESILWRVEGWIEETLRIIGSKPIEVSHKVQELDNNKIIGIVNALWQ